MMDKSIDWLTEVVTGSDPISRMLIIAICVIVTSSAIWFIIKEPAPGGLIGAPEQQIPINKL